jgi:hypothetical protein
MNSTRSALRRPTAARVATPVALARTLSPSLFPVPGSLFPTRCSLLDILSAFSAFSALLAPSRLPRRLPSLAYARCVPSLSTPSPQPTRSQRPWGSGAAPGAVQDPPGEWRAAWPAHRRPVF